MISMGVFWDILGMYGINDSVIVNMCYTVLQHLA